MASKVGEIYSRNMHADTFAFATQSLGKIEFTAGKYSLQSDYFQGCDSVWDAMSVTSVNVLSKGTVVKQWIHVDDEEDGEVWWWVERTRVARKTVRQYFLIDYRDQMFLDSSTDKDGWWELTDLR